MLISCEKENESSKVISKLDIVDAKSLVIMPSSNGLKSTQSSTSKLFKVTEEGYLLEVNIYSDGGELISSEEYQPTAIQDLSEDYLMIIFTSSGYLVEKTDGKVFELPNGDILASNFDEGNGDLVKAYNDYIYYLNNTNDIVKLDISNSNNLTRESYQAKGDEVFGFASDIFGNIVYKGNDMSGSTALRLKKKSGGLELLPGNYNLMFWEGFDSCLYVYSPSNPYTSPKKITIEPFSLTDYGSTSINTNFLSHTFKMRNKNKIIGIGSYNIIEIYNSDDNCVNIEFETFNLSDIKFGGSSDNYYYLGGTSNDSKPILQRVNPDDHSYTTIINGEYDIYSFDVSSDDYITFDALRLSDGSLVIGEIAPNMEISIISENNESKVTVLTRIE